MTQPRDQWIQADFNGLFGPILCLAHEDVVKDLSGRDVQLRAGMIVTAYDEDLDENDQPDWLLATGVVEPSPESLRCRGSRWILRLDENGWFHESDLPKTSAG